MERRNLKFGSIFRLSECIVTFDLISIIFFVDLLRSGQIHLFAIPWRALTKQLCSLEFLDQSHVLSGGSRKAWHDRHI
ncbi:hypothetical protein L6452_21262 [Arctium lappa]|uniref:Uncharacterized protein n=1 Tax=Arctium lappa TaxID=4217 RepID=A0ACB9BEX9_ARCLA|nr:hypothetical protein L6452_21262 [Arctium lappa]